MKIFANEDDFMIIEFKLSTRETVTRLFIPTDKSLSNYLLAWHDATSAIIKQAGVELAEIEYIKVVKR